MEYNSWWSVLTGCIITLSQDFGEHGFFVGKLVSFSSDYYHIVYEDGDDEDISLGEMSTVVAQFQADTKKKKVVKKSLGRKKLETRASKSERRSSVADTDDDVPEIKNKQKKQRILDDDGFDDELRVSRRKSVKKKLILDSDEDEEFEKPTRVNKRTSPRKAVQRKVIVDSDSFSEEGDDEESFVLKSDGDDEDQLEDDQLSAETEETEEEEPTPPPKKKAKAAPSKSWGFLDGKQSKKATAPKKKPTTKPKVSDDSATAPGAGRSYGKAAYSAGDDLPIISAPQEMFDDMISNKLTDGGKTTNLIVPLLKKLHHRPLRVATMCSGTESPILALDMITKSIEDFFRSKFKDDKSFDHLIQIEHVFSCEIEPFKQAYIERNFQPPLLFRDIRELGNDQAHTAYGSLAQVPNTPGCVDMLVAGTSCVDYSNLNVKQVSC